jgi:hypothetical protein
VQASALAGYTFLQFSGNLSGAANPQSLLMDGPKTVTASFRSTTAAAAPVLEAGVIAKTSSEDGRSLWTILFSNSGAGAATDAQISNVIPTQIGGTACSPVISVATPMPVRIGTIAPGGNATAQVNFTANGGTYSSSAIFSD